VGRAALWYRQTYDRVSGNFLPIALILLRLHCNPGHLSKNGPEGPLFNFLIFLRKSGAGEGIRTLDPNLGKVVLYP
jgi:hypothetical protein